MRIFSASLIFAASSLVGAAFAGPALAGAVGQVSLAPEAQEQFSKTYGAREAAELTAYIERALARELSARGIDKNGPLTIETVLLDATPSRPTFEQLNDDVSLSMESVALGGAELRARLIDANGQVVGEVRHRWYEHDIERAFSSSTWTETKYAIRRFARKVADAYAERTA